MSSVAPLMTYDVNKLASKEQVDDKLSFDGSRDIKGVTRVFKVQSQNFHFLDPRCPHDHVTDLKLLRLPFLTLRNISIDKTLLKNVLRAPLIGKWFFSTFLA